MTTDRLNLSRRPFVNNRPVTRTAILLWALGFLLLLVNVFSVWSYLESSREKRADVKAGEAKLAAARATLAKREAQVAGLELGRQNDEVAYLNGKIAQRTFSWSRLMDRVSEVMPNDVRLQRLSPHGVADEREGRPVKRAAARRQSLDRVTLTIDGQGRSHEAILELVDNLFDLPFAEPNLTHESQDAGGLIRFNLTVAYLPNVPLAGRVRPQPRHWKISPAPGAPSIPGTLGTPPPQLQAGTPAAPAFRTVPRPLPPSAPAPSTFGNAGASPPPAFRPSSRPLTRPGASSNDPLRGIGSPTRPRTPPPPENGVPLEGGRR